MIGQDPAEAVVVRGGMRLVPRATERQPYNWPLTDGSSPLET